MKRLALLFLLSLPLAAQSVTQQRPDCWFPIFPPFSGSGSTGPFDNSQAGCTSWVFVYTNMGFSGVSIVVQTSSTTPTGPWTTFTAVSGSNPATSTTTGVATFGGSTSYFPYLRVTLTATGSGTLIGTLYGWRIPSDAGAGGGSTGCPGTSGTPCVVVGTKTNNNAAPGTNNVGALVALANASPPSDTEGDQVLLSTDLAGNLRTSGSFTAAASTTALSGQQAVTATAANLGNNALTNGVCVKALIGNAINVYVGGSGVTISTGQELAPDESFCYNFANTSDVYVIASTTGASVSWGAGH